MDALPLQILILKRIRLPDLLQIPDHDMFAYAELLIPARTHLRGNILKISLFRLRSFGHPFIGIVVAACLVLLEDISPLPMQRFSQMLKQHFQRLIRRLLQQSNAESLIDHGLQILHALHPAVLLTASDARFISAGPFVKLPCIIHMSASIYTAFRP